jgi:hypothetical protein
VILAHSNATALLFQMRQTEAEYARAAEEQFRVSIHQLRSQTGEPYPPVGSMRLDHTS